MKEGSIKKNNILYENAHKLFRGLSLEDVYGRVRENPREIKLTPDQHRKLSDADSEEWRKFANQYGIEEVGSLESGRRGFFLCESVTTKKLSLWLPHVEERQLILQISQAVSLGNKPRVLEVGHGSGLVANLLGIDKHADIIGVDNNSDRLTTEIIPNIPNVKLFEGDIWDFIKRVGPIFSPQNEKSREELLSLVRKSEASFGYSEFLSGHFGLKSDLNEELSQLQSLATTRIKDSSVDVVFCSFMPLGSELTVPIRDGVFPKAIIYVRPSNGKSGAGDYYNGEEGYIMDYEKLEELGRKSTKNDFEDSEFFINPSPNTHISFNPGANYLTVARWNTAWSTDYPLPGSKHGQREIDSLSGEVMVQFRKDVVAKRTSQPEVSRYPFDEEIENSFEKDKLVEFLNGIRDIKARLLKESSSSMKNRF